MDSTWDVDVDAAYIDLRGECTEPAVRQVTVETGDDPFTIILDLSVSGRLLGVEVLGASAALDPSLLQTLHQISAAGRMSAHALDRQRDRFGWLDQEGSTSPPPDSEGSPHEG